MVKRLKDTKGESLSEVLISLLIAALAIVLLAGMINASTSMVTKSKERMEQYVSGENEMVKQSGNAVGSGQVQFESNGAPIKLNDDPSDTNVEVDYYTNGASGRYEVRSYKVK